MVYGPNPGLQVIPYGSLQGQGQPTQYSNFGFNGSIPPTNEIVSPNYVGVNQNSHIWLSISVYDKRVNKVN